MLKKALIGLLAAVMVGGMAFGLFIVAREAFLGPTATRAEGVGGRGQAAAESVAQPRASELSLVQGRGQRNNAVQAGQAGGGRVEERGAASAAAAPSVALGWQEISGTVVAYDHEMTVRTAQGDVLVGMGQSSYIEGLAFQASLGDEVVVKGYMEDGEFKAGEVRNLTTGQSVVLRDADGRPMWSGQGRGKNRDSA